MVFMLDRSGKPLMPCAEKRARLLLARGRVRAHRVVPFAIRLVDRCADAADFQSCLIRQKTVKEIRFKHCCILQRNDGYGYSYSRAITQKRVQVTAKASRASRTALYRSGPSAEVSRED